MLVRRLGVQGAGAQRWAGAGREAGRAGGVRGACRWQLGEAGAGRWASGRAAGRGSRLGPRRTGWP